MCGRIKVIVAPTRRDNNRFNDDIYNSYDDIVYDELDNILGGSYVTYGEIPWQAGILYKNQHVCSAAIINEFWVISAAQCFP